MVQECELLAILELPEVVQRMLGPRDYLMRSHLPLALEALQEEAPRLWATLRPN